MYSPDWEYLDYVIGRPQARDINEERPKSLDIMLEIARKLSKGFPHVRIDLYSIKDKVYFGEFTFSHAYGTQKFTPESFGIEMGSWIKLPELSQNKNSEVLDEKLRTG